ncbi:hypothetical protein DL98DRAFT_91032 [Cadophora sp. DSE1049]|nr:hypothetical protein DL98DRAFT_91032 [Cadophora sp. DSE1049]
MPQRRSSRLQAGSANMIRLPAHDRREAPLKSAMTSMARYAAIDAPKALEEKQAAENPLERAISKVKLELILPSQQLPTPRNPATSFQKFKKLPIELQDMVWSVAINDPIVVVTLSYRNGQFVASSNKPAILAYSNSSPSSFPLFPVYLSPALRWNIKLPSGNRDGKTSTSPPLQIDPTFLLPQDILYMPEIYKMDSDHFLARNENHAIELLAIHASSALRLGAGEYGREWSEEGEVLRVLGNLKKVLVLEGFHMGDEMQFRQPGRYHLSLVDVKRQPIAPIIGGCGTIRQRRHQTPWAADATTSIRSVFVEEMASETRRGFKATHLEFWEVQRRLIGA